MYYQQTDQQTKEKLSNATLLLIGFATAFFPRLPTYFGAPSVINFLHFGVIPLVVLITILTTRIRDRKQIAINGELLFGMGFLLACGIMSALLNQAGAVNVFLDFMIRTEPFMLLVGMLAIPVGGKGIKRFRYWVLGFALFNLLLALAQSVLLPIGVYPRSGGTVADNTAGVFAAGSGSAGNYVSCTVSLYCAFYFFNVFKTVPRWIRIAAIVAAMYQTQVSDSKQVFVALLGGAILLVLTKVKNPGKLAAYIIITVLVLVVMYWAIQNIDSLSAYRNWTNRAGLYGPDGEATRTKLAAFRIVPTYYDSLINYFFGLGPGHTVSRMGGWVLRDYETLLKPLGATVHPATSSVWQVVSDGWIAKESTIFFPLYTWAGIWGDLGIVGLGAYLFLGYITWRRLCVDDFCKFLLLSSVVFGFILTQVEEPGHVLTIACLLGLRWHEERERQLNQQIAQYFPLVNQAYLPTPIAPETQ